MRTLSLPLVIAALVASAAAANTPIVTKPVAHSIVFSCVNSGHPALDARFAGRDVHAANAIGALSGQPYLRGSSSPAKISTHSRSGSNFQPYLVASLEMLASPLDNGAPASCYPPLSLATASLPAATAGTTYSISLAANGGQPPYRWSFGQSSLPNGFSIDSVGNLSGSPSKAGSYAFHVVVTDSLKNSVTGPLTLTVAGNFPPPTQPPPTQPPTGTALTACGDLKASGSYYLANDISSTGTCFGIDANNITLNLNGHTITYGTGGGSTPTPAIEGHDAWWTGTPNYVGSTYSSSTAHGGFEAFGGNIVQSPNSAMFSDVFSFGQGSFTSAPYIHNITATFQNTGAQFYYSAYMPAGARIENNVIYDNVTNIQQPGQGYLSARSQFQGQTIFIAGQENNSVPSGDIISGNKIVGGPQGGIRSVNQHTTITNNDIAQNALYSNDWCVEISADHSTATGNNCHPKSGRGINVDASYVTVQNNTINVTELKQNAEYGGCELGGAYGVRVEALPLNGPVTPVNDVVTGNTITVDASDCNAMGFDLIYLEADANVSITNNTITTTNAGKSGVQDAGFQFDDSFGNGITITGNTVTSANQWMYGDWDGYSNITVGHNTWLGSPQLTFFAADGGCDPSVAGTMVSCPVSINITDALPNKMSCGPYSEAKVTINGQSTQCKASQ